MQLDVTGRRQLGQSLSAVIMDAGMWDLGDDIGTRIFCQAGSFEFRRPSQRVVPRFAPSGWGAWSPKRLKGWLTQASTAVP